MRRIPEIPQNALDIFCACSLILLWHVGPRCATFTYCWIAFLAQEAWLPPIQTFFFLISKNRPFRLLCFHNQISKVFDTICMGRHNQSSFYFFLTSSDKTCFYDQNSFTSGYRQDKKPKLAMHSLVFTMITPGTFTSISPPTSSQLENHPGHKGTTECSHAPRQS